MKVKNTSRSAIRLLNGKQKVTLVPGTDEVYEVTDCPDVQYLIEKGDLTEAVGRSKPAPKKNEDKGTVSEEKDKK